MDRHRVLYPVVAGLLLCFFVACKSKSKKSDHIANTPQEMEQKAADLIRDFLGDISDDGLAPDSVRLRQARLAGLVYERSAYAPVWSKLERWLPAADSLYQFAAQSKLYGLFPDDYHIRELSSIRERILADSLGKGDRRDAELWSKADVMMTDAFMQLVKDIKLGRLPQDSITLRKDSVLSDEFYLQQFDLLQQSGGLAKIAHDLEPKHKGYQLLKKGIASFLAKADNREYTLVPAPKDSLVFRKNLQRRLYEGGYISSDSVVADSAQLADAVKAFQKEKGIAVDGKVGEATRRMLNTNDREKFIRIAISMDKYKMLADKMPERYIWVNASANYLQVVEKDSVKLSSKVICGKPATRTPVLTSNISALITYPQWVPPPSIVSKEILPAVKRNPDYLARKGFSLVDKDGNEVDPYSVDWSKYNKWIPYRIVQGSGDANALGVFKFHFDNKFSVYLHDTNQRYLFGQAMRSLSHGCVRVQEWEKLAYYILRNDSLNARNDNYTRIDSVKSWLDRKEKHSIAIRNKIPVFIRYITCEGQDGGIVFYDDVYGEDKRLREKYFASK